MCSKKQKKESRKNKALQYQYQMAYAVHHAAAPYHAYDSNIYSDIPGNSNPNKIDFGKKGSSQKRKK